jgi:hypothetical protein
MAEESRFRSGAPGTPVSIPAIKICPETRDRTLEELEGDVREHDPERFAHAAPADIHGSRSIVGIDAQIPVRVLIDSCAGGHQGWARHYGKGMNSVH